MKERTIEASGRGQLNDMLIEEKAKLLMGSIAATVMMPSGASLAGSVRTAVDLALVLRRGWVAWTPRRSTLTHLPM